MKENAKCHPQLWLNFKFVIDNNVIMNNQKNSSLDRDSL